MRLSTRGLFGLLWIIILLLSLLWCHSVGSTTTDQEDEEEKENEEANKLPPAPKLLNQEKLDCNCVCRDIDHPSPHPARILYLITVHNYRTLEDAVPLFRAIRSPQNNILIHIDTKLDWQVYVNSTLYNEVEACPCGSEVVVESVHSAKWSLWSMNDPTLWGMEMALSPRFRNEWDVFINLSGDTMPVYTTEVMAKLFDPSVGPLRKTNFVTSSSCETGLVPTSVYIFPKHWHKRAHYTNNNPSGDPVINYVDNNGKKQTIRLITHFGSQWMALQPSFVEYLITSLQRNDSLPSLYKEELIRTKRLMTDETFIPTLLMHVPPFNETLPVVNKNGTLQSLPTMSAIRYERMDEHVPTAFGAVVSEQRYEVPESSIADTPKVWGPYFLGAYDLANLRDSGALFVRKVSQFVDPNIVNLLPVRKANEIPYIQWPREVKISPKVDWDKRIHEWMEKAKKDKAVKEKVKEEEEQEVKDHAKAKQS